MEILQEIGSYAGIAAILGLAVLSALYFSQARDVKRLREWAGRAPDRAPTPSVPAQQPRGVVAQPIAKPPSRPVPGGTPPPVPRPPGAHPATPPAAASAAGAAPAVAKGPEASDDDAADRDEIDVTSMDTVVHPPPTPLEDEDEDGDGTEGEATAAGEIDEGPDDRPAEGDEEQPTGEHTGDYEAVAGEETGDYAAVEGGDTGEYTAAEGGDTGEYAAAEDTGEWRPEDEHADIDFTDEHDAVGPATPAAAAAPRPPTPPQPYQRRGAPGAATGYARDRESILPPYAEARPQDGAGAGEHSGRRPILLVVAAMIAIAVVAFGVLQLTGGDDTDGGGGGGSGLSAGGDATGGGSGGGGGGSDAPPIDPSSVTVAVLNGTTVPGLAATVGDTIAGEGFQLGTVTNNFDQERAESVVLYAPGSEREAADVGRRLDISQREEIDAESQALAGDATVVVVAGADQNQ